MTYWSLNCKKEWAAIFVAAFVSSGFFGGTAAGQGQGKVSEHPTFGNAPYLLSETEIHDLGAEALTGNGEAAYRLAQFYNFVRLNRTEALYWMAIAAENGLPVGIYGFGFMLRTSTSERDRIRARYWLEKARSIGVEPVSSLANSLLKEMDAKGK